MRRAARVDANQGEIVDALRKAGESVQPLHGVGGGVPDLLVTGRCDICGQRVNKLLEVKDGAKPPSWRKLTDDQVKWHGAWRGPVSIVKSIDEALRAVGVIK